MMFPPTGSSRIIASSGFSLFTVTAATPGATPGPSLGKQRKKVHTRSPGLTSTLLGSVRRFFSAADIGWFAPSFGRLAGVWLGMLSPVPNRAVLGFSVLAISLR